MIASDLAAAYTHLAELTDRSDLLITAYRHAHNATLLDANLAPAQFNRALVLSEIGLSDAAARAWALYIERFPHDGWNTEASAFLATLAAEPTEDTWAQSLRKATTPATAENRTAIEDLAALDRQRTRTWAEHDLLAQWARAAPGSPEANNALARARTVGKTLARLEGDQTLALELSRLDGATPPQRSQFRQAHTYLLAGHAALYDEWDLVRAQSQLTKAFDGLSSLQSYYAGWAALFLAVCDYYAQSLPAAETRLRDLSAQVDTRKSPSLAARTWWTLALIESVTLRLEDAVRNFGQAHAFALQAGDRQNVAVLHALLAEVLDKLGRRTDGWNHGLQALANIDAVFEPTRRHIIYEALLFNARRHGDEEFARELADAHITSALASRAPQILHYAYMQRAAILEILGSHAAAREDYVNATGAATQLHDPTLRQRSRADSDLLAAEIALAEDPAGAAARLTRTIETYKDLGYRFRLPRAYAARARAHLELGDAVGIERAAQDLAAEIGLHEASARDLDEHRSRIPFARGAMAAFDRMIFLQAITLGRPDRALAYAERSRAMWLTEGLRQAPTPSIELRSEHTPRSSSLKNITKSPPPNIGLLAFSVHESRTFAWIVVGGETTYFEVSAGSRELAKHAASLRAVILRHRPSQVLREKLFELLIRPALPALDGIDTLVVIPDKSLIDVPFELLHDHQRDEPLISVLGIAYAPSVANALGWAHKHAGKVFGPDTKAVSLGGRSEGIRFPSLPNANAETRDVAAAYRNGHQLDRLLDRQGFLDAFLNADLVHFAGHTVIDSNLPFASKLVLVDTLDQSEELFAHELLGRNLSGTRLMILSSCSSAQAGGSAEEATVIGGLARAFLSAGIPAVIGSLWPVDDTSAHSFFQHFHHALSEGESPIEALRQSKLALRATDPKGASENLDWAAFVLILGGNFDRRPSE